MSSSRLADPAPPPPECFLDPCVRDLCWVLSPEYDLVRELPPHHRFIPWDDAAAVARWLWELDATPGQLAPLRDPPKRLGLYFERLVLFYLQRGPHHHGCLIDHNRAIYESSERGRVTLGEIDFLLRRDRALVHLETAVKFYLGVQRDGRSYWLGPGLQDRFDRKLTHLRERQLPLSNRLEEPPERRLFWVKGVLFHPWPAHLSLADDWIAATPPGYWLTLANLAEFAGDATWCWLPRERWLAGGGAAATAASTSELMPALHRHFANSSAAVMLQQPGDGQRLLIVPDDWPECAARALDVNP